MNPGKVLCYIFAFLALTVHETWQKYKINIGGYVYSSN